MSVFIGEIITTTKLLLISTPVSTQTDNITKISVCFYDLLHAYKNFYKESFFFAGTVQSNQINLRLSTPLTLAFHLKAVKAVEANKVLCFKQSITTKCLTVHIQVFDCHAWYVTVF